MGVAEIGEMETVMPEEIGRLRWLAMFLDIVGRGAQNIAAWREYAGDEGRIRHLARPNRHIETFFHKIDDPVVHDHVDFDSGVAIQKFRYQRRDMQPSERHRGVDLEPPMWRALQLGNRVFCFSGRH